MTYRTRDGYWVESRVSSVGNINLYVVFYTFPLVPMLVHVSIHFHRTHAKVQ